MASDPDDMSKAEHEYWEDKADALGLTNPHIEAALKTAEDICDVDWPHPSECRYDTLNDKAHDDLHRNVAAALLKAKADQNNHAARLLIQRLPNTIESIGAATILDTEARKLRAAAEELEGPEK